jgi:ectoine hydroxylase-related dioxygenase (phytanoyl-CoA dioxygenase family)
VTSFQSLGYAVVPGVFTEDECESLGQALNGANPRRAGARPLMGNPAVSGCSNDERLLSIAREALSSSTAQAFRATLFNKTSKANWLIPWHQDTALPLERRFDDPEWGAWSSKQGIWYAQAPEWALKHIVALRLHLDASTSENGPLRVIPGTHGALLSDPEVEALAAERSESAIECLSPLGGVIVVRPLTIHASSKIVNDRPRRVLHIEYAPSLVLRSGNGLGWA